LAGGNFCLKDFHPCLLLQPPEVDFDHSTASIDKYSNGISWHVPTQSKSVKNKPMAALQLLLAMR
jgi:hypothetical protein